MATFVGTAHRVLFGSLDLSGLTNDVNFGDLTRDMVEFTTFNDGGYTVMRPGQIKGAGSIKGYQDFDAGVLDAVVNATNLGTQYPVTVIPSSGTVTAGDAAWLSRGVLSGANPLDGAKGDAGKFELMFDYDTAIPRGLVAHPAAARTTTGSGTAVALAGPTATQRLYAALHVTAYSGFTKVVFKIQSDDASGFPSATDKITFTDVTGTTSEWASVAGDFSTETHHRITWTVTGTGSVTFTAAFGVI